MTTPKTRTTVAAALATGLVTSALALSGPAHAAEISVDHAQFRWGFNNESNNSAFFGGYNFFSASKLGDPGAGAQLLNNADAGASWLNGQPAGWTARQGNVTIEKRLPGSQDYGITTWAGRGVTPEGGALGAPTEPKYSDQQVVIDNGVGALDPEADDATIAWDGDFTVVYYGGLTFFYVSDPVLSVTDGVGTVKATLSGFGTSMEDTSQWVALDPVPDVTIATLEDVDVTADGLVVTPTYLGVQVTTPPGTTEQTLCTEANVAYCGSFPQDWVTFQGQTGQSSYWYTSGSSGNLNEGKVTLALTVSADAQPTTAVWQPPATGGADDTTPPPAGGTQTPPATTPPVTTPDPATAQLKAKLAKAKKALKKAKKAGNTAKVKLLKKRIKKLKKKLRA